MRVAFNARLLSAPTLRGWNRYTINLLAELPALGVELVLYTDRPLHSSHLARLPKGSYHVHVAPPMPYIVWEQCWLPRQCALDRVDVLHTPFNFGLPWSSRCPRLLTLHDAIDQIYYSPQTPWLNKIHLGALQTHLYHWIARTRADHVITVSEHAKADLVQHLGVAAEKITVIYEASDPLFQQPVAEAVRRQVRHQYQIHKPYVFYVGGWEKRKNIPFLLQAYSTARLHDVELVLAGGTDDQYTALLSLARGLNVADRVHLLGWVSDTDLPALYAEALCFINPSAYEGFGLQVCEAMATGCATLVAQATSLPEVLGSGGETFPLDNPTVLSDLLARVVRNASFRHDLQNRARTRSEDFSWQRTAHDTSKVYTTLVKHNA